MDDILLKKNVVSKTVINNNDVKSYWLGNSKHAIGIRLINLGFPQKKQRSLFILLILWLPLIISCNKKNTIQYPKDSLISGLASPIYLHPDTSIITVQDYFSDTVSFDSIVIPASITQLPSEKGILRLLTDSDRIPKLGLIHFYKNNYKYSLLFKKSDKKKYRFDISLQNKNIKSVKLMGEFNAWNPESTILKEINGIWTTQLLIESGEYQYLLVIDNKQQLDFTNNDSVSNNIGGYNSVLKIGNINNEEIPELYTIKYTDNNIYFGLSNSYKGIIALYENHEIEVIPYEERNNTYYINIPRAAREKQRSYIRVYAYSDNYESNDLLIPLNYGKVLSSTRDLTRNDYEAAVIYNVFVDRFYDGDKRNNAPLNIPEVHPKADYHGGDITGIIKQLKSGYFDSLGVNTLWISPIVENPQGYFGNYPMPKTSFSAYHGYWPISFTKIDSRLGNEKEFIELVEEAHKSNKNVLLDLVAHHIHLEHPFFKQHPQWVTDLYLPDGTLNTERWDSHRLTTWFDVFLPTLDFNNPDVTDIISDSALFWIKKYDLDGFRHDATKHVPEIFWKTLTLKLKQQVITPQNKRLFQIGETYGTPELIGSYVNSGQQDAQFDFNVYDKIVSALAGENSFVEVSQELEKSRKYYGSHHLMGNISGNQDRGRFISYADGSLSFSEDAKKAGWTRNITNQSDDGYLKSALLMAFISTIPGIPVIYYGDEIGMPGGNDPDNRRLMVFGNLNPNQRVLKSTTIKLMKLRRSSLPLIYGDLKILKNEKDILVYQRAYFKDIAIVLFNKSNTKQQISITIDDYIPTGNIKSLFNSKFSLINNKITIELMPKHFEILIN